MGEVIDLPEPYRGFEFHSVIEFDGKNTWRVRLDSCLESENYLSFICALSAAVQGKSGPKIIWEGPCECERNE